MWILKSSFSKITAFIYFIFQTLQHPPIWWDWRLWESSTAPRLYYGPTPRIGNNVFLHPQPKQHVHKQDISKSTQRILLKFYATGARACCFHTVYTLFFYSSTCFNVAGFRSSPPVAECSGTSWPPTSSTNLKTTQQWCNRELLPGFQVQYWFLFANFSYNLCVRLLSG